MSNKRFSPNSIIRQQNQEHYINLQTDMLDNALTTCPFHTGWKISIKPYLNRQFRFFDNPGRQFGNGSVPTRTQAQSDGPEPLLKLDPSEYMRIVCVIKKLVLLDELWPTLPGITTAPHIDTVMRLCMSIRSRKHPRLMWAGSEDAKP